MSFQLPCSVCCKSSVMVSFEFCNPTSCNDGKLAVACRMALRPMPKSHMISSLSFCSAFFSLAARIKSKKCLAVNSDRPPGRACSRINADSVEMLMSALM
jgi:hypothetical protein